MENEALRRGFSTGACAAAAAQAAALCLRGEKCEAVELQMPDGTSEIMAVEWVRRAGESTAEAAVVKDAGGDPDITDGVTVIARLELREGSVEFRAGAGVGRVTKPGLQIPPGEAAINPVPREMIASAARRVLGEVGFCVTVSIPGGEELAAKTFNPRLGIEGGLSILGTSGRVEPKSEEAWLRSLIPQIEVALAAGFADLYLVPGGFGEAIAREALNSPPEAIVQTSNFIGDMLDACAARGVKSVTLVGHIGKLVKVAAGIFNTHSRFGDARLETIAAMAGACGAPGPLMAELLSLPTCEAAIPVLEAAGLAHTWDAIANRAAQRATERAGIPVSCILGGYQGRVLGMSNAQRNAELGVQVVGVGPGSAEWLTPAAWKAIREAEMLVGGARHLEALAPESAEKIAIGADLGSVMKAISERADKRIVVLASGDPGCYGVLAALRRELPEIELSVIPGISAFQLALARLALPWEGVRFASAHGRSAAEVVEAAYLHPRVLALADHRHTPQALARALLDDGIEARATVLERLGYPDEVITTGTVAEIATGNFAPLSVVYFSREEKVDEHNQ